MSTAANISEETRLVQNDQDDATIYTSTNSTLNPNVGTRLM